MPVRRSIAHRLILTAPLLHRHVRKYKNSEVLFGQVAVVFNIVSAPSCARHYTNAPRQNDMANIPLMQGGTLATNLVAKALG
jgi:hypothetical protein